MSRLSPVLTFESVFEVQRENRKPTMNTCNPQVCQHFYALNIIQDENLCLKKEIESLKCDKQRTRSSVKSNQVYYQFLLEMNKENQDLCSQLLDSKRVVSELQPKLEQVLLSITNIEHTLQEKNKKMEELTTLEESVLVKPESLSVVIVPSSENHPVDVQMEVQASANDSFLIIPESESCPVITNNENTNTEVEAIQPIVKIEEDSNHSKEEDVIELDTDDATDEEEEYYVTPEVVPIPHTSEIASVSDIQPVSTDQGSHDAAPFLMMPSNLCYQELDVECSVCHVPFAQNTVQDPKASSSSPVCDKCKRMPLCYRGIPVVFESSVSQDANTEDGNSRLINVIPEAEQSNIKLKQILSSATKLYPCSTCGRVFNKLFNLKRHARLHTAPYICKTCGNGFAVLYKLLQHEKVHVHAKPSKYDCT